MKGESNLNILLKNLNPVLNEGEYVFLTFQQSVNFDHLYPICTFIEKEGTTLVIERSKADSLGFKYDFVASWITLEVHSSLRAVGLTAAFSKALADQNISCNVMAAFYHDHIFVDIKDSEKAMEILKELSNKA